MVNQASKLAAAAGEALVSAPLTLDGLFRQNLNESNTKLTAYNSSCGFYTADAVNTAMNRGYEENCK